MFAERAAASMHAEALIACRTASSSRHGARSSASLSAPVQLSSSVESTRWHPCSRRMQRTVHVLGSCNVQKLAARADARLHDRAGCVARGSRGVKAPARHERLALGVERRRHVDLRARTGSVTSVVLVPSRKPLYCSGHTASAAARRPARAHACTVTTVNTIVRRLQCSRYAFPRTAAVGDLCTFLLASSQALVTKTW
jgi:hypothetical protein